MVERYWGKISQRTNIDRSWGHGIILTPHLEQFPFQLEDCMGVIEKGVCITKLVESKDLKLGTVVAIDINKKNGSCEVWLSKEKKGGF
jgi:hypothetical protein